MSYSEFQCVIPGTFRFRDSVPALFQSITCGGPLYLHTRNWMAELAAIVDPGDPVIDDHEDSVLLPEAGLQLSLPAVEVVHGVGINYQSRRALALEFATFGEPRSLSIVAIPNISNLGYFRKCMELHHSEVLSEGEYQAWRNDFMVRPSLCPCCAGAAEMRREDSESHPLTRIVCEAIERNLPLRCQMVSEVLGFSRWITPKNLRFSEGILGVIADDGKSMLEVDLGMCHSMRIVRRRIDDEAFSEINLYDSLGLLHLRISARGWDREAVWRGL